jgi:hypothetical protein
MAITLPSYCQKVRMGSTLCQLSFKEEKGEPLRVMLALQATDHYIPHQCLNLLIVRPLYSRVTSCGA